ncbi:MAG: glycosyltransferase family 4 protein [Planctomycetota bacterium]
MKIAILGSGAESLYPRVGQCLAIQTVGLAEAWVGQHEVHVVTRTERGRHGWWRYAFRGQTQVTNGVCYHALPAEAEHVRAVGEAGSLARALLRAGYLHRFLRGVVERLRTIRPDAILIWNVSPFVEPLRRAFPSAAIILFETRGWHLGVEPHTVAGLLEPASRVFVPSRFLAQRLAAHAPELAAQIEELPLGVDTDLFRALVPRGKLPRRRDLIGGEGTIVTHVGSLTPERGVDRLLGQHARLAASMRKLHLFLLGPPVVDPPLTANDPWSTTRARYPQQIAALAASLGPEVHLRSELLPPQEIASVLGTSDLLVAPAVQPPATAQAVVEAMASAVPVVASDAGVHPELVASAEVGRLVPVGDDDAFVQACTEVAAISPDERHERGLRAREIVLARHTFEGIAARLAKRFDELWR